MPAHVCPFTGFMAAFLPEKEVSFARMAALSFLMTKAKK